MKHFRTAALGAALSVGTFAVGAPAVAAQEIDAAQVMAMVDTGVAITLEQAEGGAAAGEARLESAGEQTQVQLRLMGAPAGVALQGYLVAGACGAEGEPIAGLGEVLVNAEGNGEVTATLPVALEALLDEQISIQVRGEDDAAALVACGSHTPDADGSEHEVPATEPVPAEPSVADEAEEEEGEEARG